MSPFRSKEQRSFLKRTKPELYKKWKKKYGLKIKAEGGGKTMAKQKRKPSAWNKHLMEVYKGMKKKDSTIKLSDAMKKAKATYIKK